MRLPCNAVPLCLLGYVAPRPVLLRRASLVMLPRLAPLLRFSGRFPVLPGWLRLPRICCFLYLLFLLLRFLSSRLYCSVAPPRLLLRRFASTASSGFVAPLRFSGCVPPLRLFGHYSVFAFGALRDRLKLENLSALFRVG